MTKMMNKCFYDTCALLELQEEAFESFPSFVISNITLKELESIKSSSLKDEDIKYQARKLIHLLTEKEDSYEIIIYKNEWDNLLNISPYLSDNNDSRIIVSAMYYNQKTPITFVTADLCCYHLAKQTLDAEYLTISKDDYTGYREIFYNSDEELSEIYNYIYNNQNNWNLLYNQYLLIKNKKDEDIEQYKWTKEGFKKILFKDIKSKFFGSLKPKDAYQKCVIDSLINNQFTIIQGEGGTGKTLISLAYLFQELEKNNIDKIIIAVNPWAAKNSAKLGFTPGDLNTKILDTQIGNILAHKIGDRFGVECLIQEGKIELIPFSNLRGSSFDGKVGFYVTEAQNLDAYLCQLAIQRCGENTKIILEGDSLQTDLFLHKKDSGLAQATEVFKGEDLFGYVQLKNIYRSKVANIASLMKV